MKSPSLQEIMKKVEVLEREINLQRPILEVIQDPFFILDQKEEFLKANPKGMDMLVYPWEELQQITLFDVVPLEEIRSLREGFEEMKRGKEVRFRTTIVSRPEERIPVEFFGILRGEVFLITMKDLRGKTEIEEKSARMQKELKERIRERDQYVRELSVLRDLYEEKLKEIVKMREEAVLLIRTT
jgi:PAS domain S-box-containing protein